MKVLLTGRGFDSRGEHAVGVFELDQAKALKSLGHDVRFAAVDTRSVLRSRPWGIWEYELDGVPVYYISVPAGRLPFRGNDRVTKLAAERLFRYVLRSGWEPDVLHSHFGAGFLEIAGERGLPRVYTEHFSRANSAVPSAEELARQRYTYARTDRLICVSSLLAQSVKRNTGAEAVVVHNVVDTGVFLPEPRVDARENGRFRFAAGGNLIHRKGYDLLLDSLAALRDRGLAAELEILGGGEEEPALRQQAERLGISELVRFRGKVSRETMAETYRRSDAFVLASRMETFGVVYIEAMAAGLPVIATACGGPEDFVTDENGILIPPEDENALTDAMERMIRTRDRYDGTAISRSAREEFSPASIARKITDVYEELLRT